MSDHLFDTERLYVRPLSGDDIADYYSLVSDPEVMAYVKPPLDLNEAAAELEKFMGYYNQPDKFYNIWAVISKSKDEFVGICGVYENQSGEHEIAYRLQKSHWKLGYGIEIASGLVRHAFSALKIANLVAYVFSLNIGSVKILERIMKFQSESWHEPTGQLGRKYVLSNHN